MVHLLNLRSVVGRAVCYLPFWNPLFWNISCVLSMKRHSSVRSPVVHLTGRTSRTLNIHLLLNNNQLRLLSNSIVVGFPLSVAQMAELSRSSDDGLALLVCKLEALRDLHEAFAMTPSPELQLAKAIAKMELRVWQFCHQRYGGVVPEIMDGIDEQASCNAGSCC